MLSIARRVPHGLQQYRNGGNGASSCTVSTSAPRSLYCARGTQHNEEVTCVSSAGDRAPRGSSRIFAEIKPVCRPTPCAAPQQQPGVLPRGMRGSPGPPWRSASSRGCRCARAACTPAACRPVTTSRGSVTPPGWAAPAAADEARRAGQGPPVGCRWPPGTPAIPLHVRVRDISILRSCSRQETRLPFWGPKSAADCELR